MAEKSEKKGLKKEGGSSKEGAKAPSGSRAFKQGEEKVLIIPLRKESRKSARNMRKNRSVREVRAFLSRHMKTEPSKVMISQQLNESLWKGGLHNNQARIKVKVSTGEEGKVFAMLIDEKEKPRKAKKSRLGLRERLARRKEGAEEPAGKKEEKDSGKKPEQQKEGDKSPSKERSTSKSDEKKPEETPPEETEQDILIEE